MFIFVPPPPSREARALAERLADAAREHLKEFPQAKGLDLHQGFALARQQIHRETGGARSASLVMGLILGLAALVGLLAVFLLQGGVDQLRSWSVVIGVSLVIAVGLGAAVFVARR